MNGELLQQAVMDIASKGYAPRFQFRAVFTSGQLKVEALAVNERHIRSDFASSFTSDISIKVATTTAVFLQLFAVRDNLSVTLFKEQVDPISDRVIVTGKKSQQTYRAFLKDNEIASLASDQGLQSVPFSDGKDDLRIFTVQLIDSLALSMSAKSAQAVFRLSETAKSLAAFIVLKADEDRANGLPGMAGFDMIEPDVSGIDNVRDQIIVDHTVKMVELPAFLQANEDGIYNHGIGSFIKDRFWYVYPLYNTRRYTKTERRLTIFATSTLKLPIADTTYVRNGENLTIISMGEVTTQDLSVAGDISGGLGVRFTKSKEFFGEQSVDSGDNRSVYNREGFTAQVRTKAREDGLEFAPVATDAFTNNLPFELSRIAMRSGMIMFLTWQRSAIELLTPGMPVRVYYDNGNKVVELDGCLLEATEQCTPERPGLMQKVQKSVCGLFLFLEKP